MTDILQAVLDACERTPHSAALTIGNTTLTFGAFRQRILSVAGALTAAGLVPGDRMLFSVRPQIDGVCLALGAIAAGATVVFADPGAGESLFRARAALARPAWVAAESVLYSASAGPARRLARRRGLELPDYRGVVPHARHIYAGAWLPRVPRAALSLTRLFRASPARGALEASAEALIIFTSGTTSAPKAVVHSRRSLGAGLGDFASAVGFVAGERVLTDQLMVGIPALISGAHWILPKSGADAGARPKRYRALLAQADVLFAVPAALDALLRITEKRPLAANTLRTVLIGGAPVLRPLLERARKQLPGTKILAVYGMTEILPVAIADGDAKLAFEGPGDFVGELMPSIRATIREGELVVAGPGLASYLGEPPLTELRTGDLARIDDGRVTLNGRSKDMFIRGTTNVYPGLYEPVIAGIPGVRDAAIVAVPNEIGDDELVLALVLEGTSPQAVRRCLPGLIDAMVLPDRLVVLSEFPKAGRSMKLDRAALVELVR